MGKMKRLNITRIAILALSSAGCWAPVQAQDGQVVVAAQSKAPEVREDMPPSIPFSLGDKRSGTSDAVLFRLSDQMTQTDQNIVAAARTSIDEHAALFGLELSQGNWAYQQLICSGLSDHIFLVFTRNDGPGDLSRFSVSIPLGVNGKVRVIPIRRRGYSLFSPAAVSLATIRTFNAIRAEDHSQKSPDWLDVGLCYAALAGGRPKPAMPALNNQPDSFPAYMEPTIEVSSGGGSIIRFTDVGSPSIPVQWSMTFDERGTLLKAKKGPAFPLKPRPGQDTSVPTQ